jgi:hypothetical protein
VEGNILADPQGRLYNIYRSSFLEALSAKEVRVFRNSTMGHLCYRYFVTSREQLHRFWDDREFGSEEGPNKTYHVYVDEDCRQGANQFLIPSREQPVN